MAETASFTALDGTPAFRATQMTFANDGSITMGFAVGIVNSQSAFVQLAAPAAQLSAEEALEITSAKSAEGVETPMATQLQTLVVTKLRALGRIAF